jgi:hypothetical protein
MDLFVNAEYRLRFSSETSLSLQRYLHLFQISVIMLDGVMGRCVPASDFTDRNLRRIYVYL